MKKLLIAAFAFCSLSAIAQEDKDVIIEKRIEGTPVERKKTQEIVIRSKGDKNKKITVEISGDKVTINGKPIAEFKDDEITINKRNITIFDGKNRMMFEPNDIEIFFEDPIKARLLNEARKPSAFLGVTTAVINEDKNDTKPNGAVIVNVTNGTGADKAGLKVEDIITKVNDTKIESPADLTEAISAKKPKEEITITYKRNGKESTTKATLGERKESIAKTYSFSGPNGQFRSFDMPDFQMNQERLGDLQLKLKDLKGNIDGGNLNFNNINPNDIESITVLKGRQKIGLKVQDVEEGSGVKVLNTDEDSPAEKAGLKKDDVITEINGKAVNNTDEARELLKPEEGKNNYTIKAKRNGTTMSFDVKIPKKLKTANL
jgi:serine protease Do